MFRASIQDPRLFKNLLTAVSTLVDETDLTASPEGLKLRSMDPSHVAMVDFEWPKAAFEEYDCGQATKIRISLVGILKLLKRIKPDETLAVAYDPNTKKLELALKGKISRRFTVPTLEPTGEEVPTPKIAFNSKVKLTAESLRDVIEDTQAISDSVKLETMAEKFIVRSASELSSAVIELEKGSEAILEIDVKEPCKATYNLNYLAEITKAGASASEVVALEFSTNMPIRLGFEMAQQGQLVYYLAPRIEAE